MRIFHRMFATLSTILYLLSSHKEQKKYLIFVICVARLNKS